MRKESTSATELLEGTPVKNQKESANQLMEGTPVKHRNESEEMYKLLQRKEGAYQLLEEVYKLLEGTPVKHRKESASQLLEEVLQRKESAYQLLEERYKLLEDTPVKNRVESTTQLLEEVYKLLEGTPVEHLKESVYQLLGKLDEVEHRKESEYQLLEELCAYQLLKEAYQQPGGLDEVEHRKESACQLQKEADQLLKEADQLLEEAYQLLLEAYQLLEEVYKLLEGTPVEHRKESGCQLLHPKKSASQLLAALLLRKRYQTLWKAKEPKIQKVKVRDQMNFEEHYEPRLLSLGPIHHGKENYQLGEQYKRVWAYDFIDGCRKTMDNLFEKIEEKIEELRDCYEEGVTENYDDKDLAWLLFVDGCAILQFIYWAINKGNSKLGIINNSVDFVHGDLFLLENQLPYRLLKLLESDDNEKELRDSIETYIQMHVMVPEGNPKEPRILRDEEPIHLLDLLRTALLGNPHEDSVIIRNRKRDQHRISRRNVQELKAAGIHLRRSSNSCLRDISFSQSLNLLGHLYIPPITLNNLTRPMFLNLVAYEKCDNFKNDFEVTSYIAFLRSLIKEAKDVRELRKAGIFYNLVGSDEEVAKLFNEMPFIPTNIGVEEKIEEYYGTMSTLMSPIYHENFKSTSRGIFKLLVEVLGLNGNNFKSTSWGIFKLLVGVLGLNGIKYMTWMYPFIHAMKFSHDLAFLELNFLTIILIKRSVWQRKLLSSCQVGRESSLIENLPFSFILTPSQYDLMAPSSFPAGMSSFSSL